MASARSFIDCSGMCGRFGRSGKLSESVNATGSIGTTFSPTCALYNRSPLSSNCLTNSPAHLHLTVVTCLFSRINNRTVAGIAHARDESLDRRGIDIRLLDWDLNAHHSRRYFSALASAIRDQVKVRSGSCQTGRLLQQQRS